MYGESALLLKYFDLFYSVYPYHNLTNTTANDQPYLNYLYLNGLLTQFGIKYEVDRPYGIFAEICCVRFFNPRKMYGNFQDNSNTIQAAVIHQYYKRTDKWLLSDSCPQGDHPVSNFYRKWMNY